MLVEVQHLDTTILSLKADKEFTVENLKHIISQNIHIPPSDLTLASNGEVLEDGHRFSNYCFGDVCKVLLFLRRGEQIRINIEVDFGKGKMIYIPVCVNWSVGEFKQKLQKTIKDKLFDKNNFLTFSRYIMEDDRTLEEYKVKEGSRITVFSYLDRDEKENSRLNEVNRKNGLDRPYQGNHRQEALEKEALEDFPTFEESEEPNEDIPSYATDLPPSPSPTLMEADKAEPETNQLTESSIPPPISEQQYPSRNSPQLPTEHSPMNSSINNRNGPESPGPWQTAMEPKTIVIPGGFRHRPGRSVFNRKPISESPMLEKSKSTDKMEVNFTDGSRKMIIELPTTATVADGLEAVKSRISDSDKERLRLFKGCVQMEGHHPLSQYGVVHASTLVFKKPGPVRKF
ncbi:unnamed protein product [Rodentolepis nana]|uniref:Ubiquitin-like domain-containing protein n=1 Tax=Rodentolepis nana TaxID=102285 RepID=A0A0R3T4A2_RODNA|nr:unnamed protein product [Rodentolepis nana]